MDDAGRLGLVRAMELVGAPQGRTFFYRHEHKRVIEVGWQDAQRLDRIRGPLMYCVTDSDGTFRYFGRHWRDTPLRSRWFRHGFVHHQTSTRNRILTELDAGRGPVTVWSASAAELRERADGRYVTVPDPVFIAFLESRWVAQWRPHLWNIQAPPPPAGCVDEGGWWD
jgi:hypothetical protein